MSGSPQVILSALEQVRLDASDKIIGLDWENPIVDGCIVRAP